VKIPVSAKKIQETIRELLKKLPDDEQAAQQLAQLAESGSLFQSHTRILIFFSYSYCCFLQLFCVLKQRLKFVPKSFDIAL
jgi:hypothetical protein